LEDIKLFKKSDYYSKRELKNGGHSEERNYQSMPGC
jgi:hypothetical protein